MSAPTAILAPPAATTDSSRLALTLFLALILHALLILGLNFEADPAPPPAAALTLDVTWVSLPSSVPPETPVERMAETDQAASAREPLPDAPTPAPSPAPLPTPEPIPLPPVPEPVPEPVMMVPEPIPTVLPQTLADPQPTLQPEPAPRPRSPEPTPALPPPLPAAGELMARGLDSIRTQPWTDPPTPALRAPRTHFLDTLSARGAPEAAYLEAWIRKVERIGNINYPEEARRRGLSGSLVLSVRLNAEGEVLNIDVTQSSGEPVLDRAAIRIVELAQPFTPFTDAMRERYDQLVITRTWAFRRDRMEQVR